MLCMGMHTQRPSHPAPWQSHWQCPAIGCSAGSESREQPHGEMAALGEPYPASGGSGEFPSRRGSFSTHPAVRETLQVL